MSNTKYHGLRHETVSVHSVSKTSHVKLNDVYFDVLSVQRDPTVQGTVYS